MTLWQRFKALFVDDGPTQSAGNLLAGILQSGQAPRRGTRELLLAYKRLPMLHSAVHRISFDLASIPFRLYQAQGGRTAKYFGGQGKVRREMLQEARLAGELREVPAHPFLDLMAKLNPALRSVTTRFITQVYLDLAGEAFWVHERNGLSNVLESWPVPPHWMADIPNARAPFFRASYLGWQRTFPERDVLWMKHPDPENPYARGTGLGVSMADELDVDEYAAQYVKGWFHNRAMPAALVSLKDAGQAELDRFKENWNQDLRGPTKGGLVKFVGSEIKVEQLSDTFKEQELPALRKASRELIIQVLNVPPECMGIIENSNRATIDAAYFLYATGVLCPRMDFLVDQLQPLADEWDETLVVDYVSPVPEDKVFQKEVMVALPGNYTVDEHRALANKQPLPDGAGEELYDPLGALMPAPGAPGAPAPAKPDPKEDPAAEDPEEDDTEPKWARNLRRRAARLERKDLTISELEQVLEKLRPERLTNEVDDVWEDNMRKWGSRMLEELDASLSFNMRNPLIREHLEKFSTTRIKDLVNSTTRDELRDTLTEGVYAGEGISDLEARVADVFNYADKVRARRIARTEVVGSSNFANLRAFEMSGVVASKEWLSVQDGHTRDTHRELDGDKVSVAGEFRSSSGHSAQHPGGFGVAEEDINCRCSVLPVVDDGKAGGLVITKDETRADVWKRYDKRLIPWEKQGAAALRRGFNKQRDDVLNALARLG